MESQLESRHYFIVTGEKSGDLIASALVKELQKKAPDAVFEGVAGPEMRQRGVRSVVDQERFEVFGFSQVFKRFFSLKKQFKKVLEYILQSKPSCVVLVDYPGFNLRLAKQLRAKGYRGKIVQYVSPTVWAWGKGRIEVMVNTLDLLLTIYPFEQQYFTDYPLRVEYIGNPIQELVATHKYDEHWKEKFGLAPEKALIALFPGSRLQEIKNHLVPQLLAAKEIKKIYPELQIVLSCAHESIMPEIQQELLQAELVLNKDFFLLPKAYAYELMRDARGAFAKSGTVTLELALHRCPTVVMYQVALFNRLIAKYLIRLKLRLFCIVNILAGKEVFPEFVRKKWSVKKLVRTFLPLFEEGESRLKTLKSCDQIKEILGDSRASIKGANAIETLF